MCLEFKLTKKEQSCTPRWRFASVLSPRRAVYSKFVIFICNRIQKSTFIDSWKSCRISGFDDTREPCVFFYSNSPKLVVTVRRSSVIFRLLDFTLRISHHVPRTDSASKLYYISPEILQQIQVRIALYSGNFWIRNFTREFFYICVNTVELLILFFDLVSRRFSHHGKRTLCRNGQFHDSLWLVGITDHFLAMCLQRHGT